MLLPPPPGVPPPNPPDTLPVSPDHAGVCAPSAPADHAGVSCLSAVADHAGVAGLSAVADHAGVAGLSAAADHADHADHAAPSAVADHADHADHAAPSAVADHGARVARNEVGVDAAATQERIDRLTARIDKLYTVRPGPSDREVNAATIVVFCYAAAAVTAALAFLAHYRSVAIVVGVTLIATLWPFVWAIWTRHKASVDRRSTECLEQRRDLRLSRGCGTTGCEDCYDVDGSNRLG